MHGSPLTSFASDLERGLSTTNALTPRERAIAQARLNRDHRPQSHGGMTGWEGFKAIVNDPNAWMLMIVYASCEYRSLLRQGNAGC